MKKHNVLNLEKKKMLCKLIARLYMVIIISDVSHTKFLDLVIGNTLSWINQVNRIVNKLELCLLMLRYVKLLSYSSLIIIYYTLFHSIMSYGIIFWRNSSHSQKSFKLQIIAIRIITGNRNKDSCRNLFKRLGVKLQYPFFLLFFYMWWRTGIILQPTMTLIINQLETVKIYVFWLPPYPYTNRMFNTQV
jgi:hypothetical protein